MNDCCLSHSAYCIGYNNPSTWRQLTDLLQKFLSVFRLLCYFPLSLPLACDTGIRTNHIQPWDAGPGVRRTRLESYLRLFLATCPWASHFTSRNSISGLWKGITLLWGLSERAELKASGKLYQALHTSGPFIQPSPTYGCALESCPDTSDVDSSCHLGP